MPTVRASWLQQGYFVLRNEGLMREVRDILEKSLRLRQGSLQVRMYPEEPKWKHTYWWREERAAYAEAQLFAQIARAYPVLSLGVAVEKGYGSVKTAKSSKKRMTNSWDWHRLIANAKTVLGADVRAIGKRVQRPLTLRITRRPASGEGSETNAYSFVDGDWYERYVGHGTTRRIVEHLSDVNGMRDHWAIAHLACDLFPTEADGLTASDLARTLLAFNEVRQRLRGHLE